MSRHFTAIVLKVGALSKCQSQSHITTDSQSPSLSWCQAPIWDKLPICQFCLDSCGFVEVGRPL
jgi:hypothetical protein